jgi:hypothetical protein
MGGEKVLKFDPQSLSSASKKQKGASIETAAIFHWHPCGGPAAASFILLKVRSQKGKGKSGA